VYKDRLLESGNRVAMTVLGVPKFPVSVYKGLVRAERQERSEGEVRLREELSKLDKEAGQLGLDNKRLSDKDRLRRTQLNRISLLLSKLKDKPTRREAIVSQEVGSTFSALKPQSYAEVRMAHMELLEARAEAFAEGREWDTKEGRSKHDAIRAHARELGIDSEKTWKRALGDVRRQYTDLFNDAIDRKADASRYVRARTGLGYSIKNEQMPLARNHALGLIEKGVPRNVAQAWLDRARAAFDAAKG